MSSNGQETQAPAAEESAGQCPKGGEHDYDKEACRKCHEPLNGEASEPVENDESGKLFGKLLEHLRQSTLLLDQINRVVPNSKMRQEIFDSLEVANQDVIKWRKSAKTRS